MQTAKKATFLMSFRLKSIKRDRLAHHRVRDLEHLRFRRVRIHVSL